MRLPHILLLCAVTLSAAGRQVAITIDDLPRGGDLGPTDLASIRAMTDCNQDWPMAPDGSIHIPAK